jgi:hypothetical protein
MELSMNENLETKKCVVAFIDLLGTSEAIKNDENDTNLNTMNYILQSAIDMSADNHLTKATVQVKAFSDNIVFAMEIPNDSDNMEHMSRVHNILEICAYFQIAAFKMGISTRGGITIGDFFCNEIFVWGKGLLRAYTLESKIAIFPRIVIDTNVISLVPDCDNSGKKHHIKTDVDGVVFLDYLSFFCSNTRNEYIKRTLNDAKRIVNLLNKDERAIQKIRWIISYLENGLLPSTIDEVE